MSTSSALFDDDDEGEWVRDGLKGATPAKSSPSPKRSSPKPSPKKSSTEGVSCHTAVEQHALHATGCLAFDRSLSVAGKHSAGTRGCATVHRCCRWWPCCGPATSGQLRTDSGQRKRRSVAPRSSLPAVECAAAYGRFLSHFPFCSLCQETSLARKRSYLSCLDTSQGFAATLPGSELVLPLLTPCSPPPDQPHPLTTFCLCPTVPLSHSLFLSSRFVPALQEQGHHV